MEHLAVSRLMTDFPVSRLEFSQNSKYLIALQLQSQKVFGFDVQDIHIDRKELSRDESMKVTIGVDALNAVAVVDSNSQGTVIASDVSDIAFGQDHLLLSSPSRGLDFFDGRNVVQNIALSNTSSHSFASAGKDKIMYRICAATNCVLALESRIDYDEIEHCNRSEGVTTTNPGYACFESAEALDTDRSLKFWRVWRCDSPDSQPISYDPEMTSCHETARCAHVSSNGNVLSYIISGRDQFNGDSLWTTNRTSHSRRELSFPPKCQRYFDQIHQLRLSPSGDIVAAATAGTIDLWLTSTGEHKELLPNGNPLLGSIDNLIGSIEDFIFDPSGEFVAIAFNHGTVQILQRRQDFFVNIFRLERKHSEDIRPCLAWSPDNKYLAIGSREDILMIPIGAMIKAGPNEIRLMQSFCEPAHGVVCYR